MIESVKVNRYSMKRGSTQSFVDAPDIITALKFDIAQHNNVEPTIVTLQEIGIAVAQPMSDLIFQVIVESIDATVPGDVYPREGSVPVGGKVYITAVPREGFKFIAFTSPSGQALGVTPTMETIINVNTQIIAKFERIPTDVGSTTVIPS